jgi:hypothetical protein
MAKILYGCSKIHMEYKIYIIQVDSKANPLFKFHRVVVCVLYVYEI